MEKKNENLLLGIVGGCIGGAIATIPWVVMYVYGNMILSLLAIIIAMGVLFGYKKFHGPMNKSLPWIIAIISVVAVVIATLLVIPGLLLVKEGLSFNINNIKLLYAYEPFKTAIIKDLMISVLFTFLGISGTISSVKKQVSEGKEVKININGNLTTEKMQNNMNIAKEAFSHFHAMDKANAVAKERILEEMHVENATQIFNTLKLQQVIKKYRGNYYFSEKAANSVWHRFIGLYGKVLLWVLVFSIIFILIIL